MFREETIQKVKDTIKENIDKCDWGIYNTRNIVGDEMTTLFDYNGITLDICYRYCYIEIFGLTDDEFSDISNFYYECKKEYKEKLFSEED